MTKSLKMSFHPTFSKIVYRGTMFIADADADAVA
jgi:hypothetical protein